MISKWCIFLSFHNDIQNGWPDVTSLLCFWHSIWQTRFNKSYNNWRVSIIMKSYEWYYWQLNCLFNSLYRLTKKTLKLCKLLALCEGNPLVTSGFPSQRASNIENFFMSWRHPVDGTLLNIAFYSLFRHPGPSSVRYFLANVLSSRLGAT